MRKNIYIIKIMIIKSNQFNKQKVKYYGKLRGEKSGFGTRTGNTA